VAPRNHETPFPHPLTLPFEADSKLLDETKKQTASRKHARNPPETEIGVHRPRPGPGPRDREWRTSLGSARECRIAVNREHCTRLHRIGPDAESRSQHTCEPSTRACPLVRQQWRTGAECEVGKLGWPQGRRTHPTDSNNMCLACPNALITISGPPRVAGSDSRSGESGCGIA